MNMRHWSMKWLLMLMAATMVAAAQDLSFEGLLKDGVKSYNNGDYKTAAEKFEDAGKLRPDDARVKYNEALSRYMNKEYEAAENGFQTAKEKGYAEDDNFKAVCDLGIGNCHYERSMQIAKDVEGKQPQEAVKQLQEAKASCEKSIDSYRDALRYSQKLKNVQDNLKTARHQRKEIVKTLRKLEEELKQQPQQQQGDQKQDGEKQDGEKQDGEQQQQNAEQQQQKDAGEQLEQLAKRQSEEAEKNEQGQQNQQQAADEQKKLSDETEQTRQAMEQQRKEAEKQDGQSSEKSEAEKKLEEAQDAQKKAEESLEKGDMKSASEAQKEAAEKLEEARKAMSEGEKKDEEEQKQDQQQQEQQQQQPQQEGNEEQMSETDNDIQNILDQERNNQRKRLKLLRVKPVERDW